MARLLGSYQEQHKKNSGGASALGGAKTIYYTKDVDGKCLQVIDDYLKETAPQIWEKYLKRYISNF